MKITITGASDDLIEIGGDIQDELDVPVSVEEEDGALISVSDGTLLRVRYDNDGIWRFARLASGSCKYSKTDGEVPKDTFDIVTLEGDLSWVALFNKVIWLTKEQR